MGWLDDETRKPIKTSVMKEVYKRAKGICENPKCDKKLPFKGGATCYHHIRKPSISPTAKTVQLLCQNCHAEHGHKHKTTTRASLLGYEKERSVKRQRVGGKPKPTKKKTAKKKTNTKKKTVKKTSTTKKKTTRKKITVRKKATLKKKPKKKPVKKKTTRKTTKRTTKKKKITKRRKK